ncbi:MAG: hypothetical protein IID36_00390 [Planctomycetes bacterium]|nr:hypothetical protein [Planctomycetota bacterium]
MEPYARTTVSVHQDQPTGSDQSAPSASLTAREWKAIGQSLHLSGRQLQIVRCLFDGLGEESTGRVLGFSRHTVHINLNRLYSRLNVHTRCQLLVRVFLAHVSLSRQADASQPLDASKGPSGGE